MSHKQYLLNIEEKLQLEKDSVMFMSRDWIYGRPDFARMEEQGTRERYIYLLMWINEYMMKHPRAKLTKSDAKHLYLITYTLDPKKQLSNQEFKAACVKEFSKKLYKRVEYTYEHEDTNIHCHAMVETNHTITYDHTKANYTFKVFKAKVGNINVKPVKVDNGIKEYITKENPEIHLIEK